MICYGHPMRCQIAAIPNYSHYLFHIYTVKEQSRPIMDIFGKSSPSTTKKTPFQSELAAKMRERKSQGLAADLTETEEDDDEALASDDGESKAFSM